MLSIFLCCCLKTFRLSFSVRIVPRLWLYRREEGWGKVEVYWCLEGMIVTHWLASSPLLSSLLKSRNSRDRLLRWAREAETNEKFLHFFNKFHVFPSLFYAILFSSSCHFPFFIPPLLPSLLLAVEDRRVFELEFPFLLPHGLRQREARRDSSVFFFRFSSFDIRFVSHSPTAQKTVSDFFAEHNIQKLTQKIIIFR